MNTAITKTSPFGRERWLKKILSRKTSLPFIRGALFLLSFPYRWGVALRNLAYDRGWMLVDRSKLPVVSIGAIVAGGTRKTPLTLHIAKQIGRPVGILTSGYAAQLKDPSKKVSSPLEGDEAYLLALKLPFAKVYAHKRRIESAKLAEKEGVDYLLLDGGFQHRALHRDLEIVTVNAKDPFADGYFLPRGFLRDFPSRLKKAHWIVVMDSESDIEFERVCDTLRKVAPQGVFIDIRSSFAYPELIRNKKVGCFCGIATPERFFRMLEKEGCQIVCQRELSDHEPFGEVGKFFQKTQELGGEFVVCTEKDFVKIALQEGKGILPLEMKLEVYQGAYEYEEMLATINRLLPPLQPLKDLFKETEGIEMVGSVSENG